MAESRQALAEASGAGETDPMYWHLQIRYAGEGTIKDDVRDVARRALALFQDPELAVFAAGYLTADWGGTPEQYIDFASVVTQLTKATYGEAMYMWLVYQIAVGDSDEAKRYDFDWARIQKGFDDIIRKAPEWLPSYHRYAKLAFHFEDREKARQLFQRRELDWFEDADLTWHQSIYDMVRRWANEKPEPKPQR